MYVHTYGIARPRQRRQRRRHRSKIHCMYCNLLDKSGSEPRGILHTKDLAHQGSCTPGDLHPRSGLKIWTQDLDVLYNVRLPGRLRATVPYIYCKSTACTYKLVKVIYTIYIFYLYIYMERDYNDTCIVLYIGAQHILQYQVK